MNFVITAGHSNTDPGAVAGTRKEADIARDMRNMVALKLRQRGHTVATDGEGEVNKPLREAIALIKSGAVAVEFHCNASTNSRATGVESISLPKHKSLAQRISKCVSEVFTISNNFSLGETYCPKLIFTEEIYPEIGLLTVTVFVMVLGVK